jgi:hypothetical protein
MRSLSGRFIFISPELVNWIFCNSDVTTSMSLSNFAESDFWPAR